MKYLTSDYEERAITTREMLEDYLEFRKKNDIWCCPAVNETSVIGLGVSKSMNQPEEDIYIPDDVRRAAMSDNRLLYAFPCNFIPTVLPIRYTAFPDICNRAGLMGRTIESFTPKTNLSVLDPLVKAYFLSTGLSLNAFDCNVLIRDEKVSSVKSHEYQIFTEADLVALLETEMKTTWDGYTFQGGAVSHEYLSVSYMLNAEDMEESFRLRMEDMNIVNVPTIKAGVQLSTSDVGNSSVSIAPFYLMDGSKVFLGNPLKIRHDKGKTLDDVKSAMGKMASLFREAEDVIEELGNTDLEHPDGCFMNLVNEYKLPKIAAKEIVGELPSDGATALDVYVALNNLVERHYAKSQLSLTGLIDMSENVAKLMYADYTKFDHISEE